MPHWTAPRFRLSAFLCPFLGTMTGAFLFPFVFSDGLGWMAGSVIGMVVGAVVSGYHCYLMHHTQKRKEASQINKTVSSSFYSTR